MSEEELNKSLLENWEFLSSKEKELLKGMGIEPK